MKHQHITVNDSTLAADLARLLEDLQPADLLRIEHAARGLTVVHGALANLFGAARSPAPDSELLERVADEVAKLSALVSEELGKAASIAHLCRNEVQDTDAALVDANERTARYKTERDKLQEFKAYVHARLDAAGVTVDPESPHKAEGCRIGGRLDEVLADLEHQKKLVTALTYRVAAQSELLARRAAKQVPPALWEQIHEAEGGYP